MTIGKRRFCRWTALAASLAASATASLPARAQSTDPAPLLAPADEDLYLEVVLNEVPVGDIVHVVRRGGRLIMDAAALRALGLTWPGAAQASGPVALDTLPGLRSHYDVADQRLAVWVPVSLLDGPVETLGYQPPPPPVLDPAAQAPGLLLNYDVYAHGNDRHRSASAWNEFRLFGLMPGVLTTSGLLQTADGTDVSARNQGVRLDTAWQLDFPDRMVTAVVGDAYNAALTWTRTTRFGGVRITRNFGLQPYRVTVPLASFAGEAAVPSAVDLYVNGIREAQGRVGPGRFEAVTAPVLNGVGSAQMVVTDLTGQAREFDFSLYNSTRLLQKGLSDWSFEAGFVRRAYGLQSNAYADTPMSTATVRHGVTDRVTLEAHGEFGDRLAMGGAGSSWLLGQSLGVASVAYAASRADGVRGQQFGLRYEWQGPSLSVNLTTLRGSEGFRDLASLEGSLLPRRTDQVFLGWSFGRGQLAANHVRQDLPGHRSIRYAGINWSQSFERGRNLSVGVNRDVSGDGGNSAFVYWSMPLGDRYHAWASAEHQRHGGSVTAGATRSLPGDRDGWGWRVEGGAGEEAGAQAEVAQLSRYGLWRVGAEHRSHHGTSGSSSAFVNATGGLLLMQGGLFPMRRAYDAFALVSTDGIADVPVLLENRLVGTTDRRGQLLVTPLNAWQENDLSIDPLVLPADVSVQRVRLAAVPATGSGVLARFPMRALVMIELSLRAPGGGWVPAGTPVTIEPGAGRATVGYDGRMYLEDPPAGATLRVDTGDGPCTVQLPQAIPGRGRLNLGEIACR